MLYCHDFIKSLQYIFSFLTANDVSAGKTFQAITEGRDDPVSVSYRLIGLALHDKYEKALEVLQSVVDQDEAVVSSDAVSCSL